MTLTWRKTPLPAGGSRTDDVFFITPDHGWAVNAAGYVYETTDGASTWTALHRFEDNTYLRCIAFSSPTRGWIGTLDSDNPLYATDDGGRTWTSVDNLPEEGPPSVCGLSVVSDDIVFAAGTNFPNRPAGVYRTTDGGASWALSTLDDMPVILVDILFTDPMTGWVVGGIDLVKHPERDSIRPDSMSAVFHTTDGGVTWVEQTEAIRRSGALPRGEWGWKIQKLGERTLLVALEHFHDGAILRSRDLGRTWERVLINDRQRNSNLEGIGFIDENVGWVGGWGRYNFEGNYTSETRDGGVVWDNANHVGRRLNRFRFLGDPVFVGYASGDGVYKLSAAPVLPSPLAGAAQPLHPPEDPPERDTDRDIAFTSDIPAGCSRHSIHVRSRFGDRVRTLVDEEGPAPGPRTITWDLTDSAGARVEPGSYIVRIVTGSSATAEIIHVNAPQPE